MSFTSLGFLFFLVGVFLFYFLTPQKYRYIALLISSYVFYYFASKKVMIYLPITTVTVYLAGRILQKLNTGAKSVPDQPEQSQADKVALRKKLAAKKKLILIATLLLNFGILAVLKYGVLIAASVKAILPAESAQLITGWLLWVAADNEAAIQLYQHLGFAPDGMASAQLISAV